MNTPYAKVWVVFRFHVKSPPHYLMESIGTNDIEHRINISNQIIVIPMREATSLDQLHVLQCDSFLAEVSML